MVKVLLLVLGLCLSHIWAAAVPPSNGDTALIEFLTKARSFGADPDRFDYCFNFATKDLTGANDDYDFDYKACIGSADKSLEAADNATAKDRNEMFRRVDNACRYVRQCQPQECGDGKCNQTVVQELNCISSTSKQSSSTLNDVAASAAMTKDQLEKNYQSIVADRDICTLQSQQRFNRKTETIYLQWENCLKGQDWTTPEDGTTTTDVPTKPTTGDYSTT